MIFLNIKDYTINMKTCIINVKCPDKAGIISKISTCLFEHQAIITDSQQHSIDDHFFLRLVFEINETLNLVESLKKIAIQINGTIDLFDTINKPRMGILVSKPDHCLHEILYSWKSTELLVDIPFIISNHLDNKDIANQYQIPYFHIPSSTQDRKENQILERVIGNTDFLVLARYMQILSADFIKKYHHPIINIHHSFLPSFKGANPYQQAYDKGVKIIGSTAHYVTPELDEGPIISQRVTSVHHQNNVTDLKLKGKQLEKQCLLDAIQAHIAHKTFIFENKTIIF